MDKNTQFDLNLSKEMAIALVVLFTGLIVQTASASPRYQSFVLGWINKINPEYSGRSNTFVSGKLLKPCAFDQGAWKEPGNAEDLRACFKTTQAA